MKGIKKQSAEGFTLLELLMVVIIIAILASIALPQYIKASEKARGSEALSTLRAIRSAENRYRAQHRSNDYTDVLAELDIVLPASSEWDVPVATVDSTTVAGTLGTGHASIARTNGQYQTETVGIEFARGVICVGDGTAFTPMTPLAACADTN